MCPNELQENTNKHMIFCNSSYQAKTNHPKLFIEFE